jgi:hypothetical protein
MQGPEFTPQCHQKKIVIMCQAYWYTPIILALEKLRQEDFEFKASLGYILSSRPD